MKARLSVMFVTALIMVVAAFQAPAAFAQEQQLNPNELQDKTMQDALQDTRSLQGLKTSSDSEGCQWWNGQKTCWPKKEIEDKRFLCTTGAVFTLGLVLLNEDCQRVLNVGVVN